MPKFNDLTVQRLGSWLVIERAENNGIVTQWLCRCSCGEERIVRAMHLVSGASQSCGCAREPVIMHGGAVGEFTKKYKTWRSIRRRTENPKSPDAHIYHGLLYDKWQDFAAFDRDVPDPPDASLTIERIKNERGYEPGNVRWASAAEQHRNQSNCRPIEFNGRTQLLSDWAKEIGIGVPGLRGRIERHGVEVALTMPYKEKNRGK
jgi:hypothetical protein